MIGDPPRTAEQLLHEALCRIFAKSLRRSSPRRRADLRIGKGQSDERHAHIAEEAGSRGTMVTFNKTAYDKTQLNLALEASIHIGLAILLFHRVSLDPAPLHSSAHLGHCHCGRCLPGLPKAAACARSLSENSSQVLLNSLETNRSVCKFVSHDQDLQNLPS